MTIINRRLFIKILVGGIAGVAIGYILYLDPFNQFNKSVPNIERGKNFGRVPIENIVNIKTIATNLEVPWSIAQVDENKYIVSERPGRLLIIDGKRGSKKLIEEFNVANVGEAGLLGVAVHPEFESKPLVYIYMSFRSGNQIMNRVISAKIDRRSWKIENIKILIDRIPGAALHDGGRLRFGPDGKLYITTGDATIPRLSQRLDSLAGKILRVEDDGSIPKDNPFEKSPIYSYGHRNPQGIDWSPITGSLIATEHGPIGHDEVNKIIPGGNYGWPYMTGTLGAEDNYIKPLIDFGATTIAPSGASFIDNESMFKGYINDYLIACLRGKRIVRIRFNDRDEVVEIYHEFIDRFGRVRDIVIDKYSGAILIATSNRDGRGSPRPDDDKIIMLEKMI